MSPTSSARLLCPRFVEDQHSVMARALWEKKPLIEKLGREGSDMQRQVLGEFWEEFKTTECRGVA